jgi:aryl sulfotransferase
MAILQAGVPRSGNLWLYRILQYVAKRAGVEPRSFIRTHPAHARFRSELSGFSDEADIDFLHIGKRRSAYWLSSIVYEPIENLDAYLRATTHVWTHSAFCERSRAVLPRFDKIIYLIRDPRDQAISLSRYAFTPGMLRANPHYEKSPDSLLANNLDEWLRSWVLHVGGYLKVKDELRIHVISYEHLLHEPEPALRRLLEYLEVDASAALLEEIMSHVSFSAMKSRDPLHVRQGESGQWRDVLTESQKGQADRIAGSMMRLLGYPRSDGPALTLPSLDARLTTRELEQAESAAHRSVRDEMGRVRSFLFGDRPFRAKLQRLRNRVRYAQR